MIRYLYYSLQLAPEAQLLLSLHFTIPAESCLAVLQTAHYLEIEPLLRLAAKRVSSLGVCCSVFLIPSILLRLITFHGRSARPRTGIAAF